MSTKIIEKTLTTTSHPMEEMFNIEPNTTEIVRIEQTSELVESELYDDKDNEIEENFQEVYDKAMLGFDTLQEEAEDIDSKYLARINEVAIQYLNAGLNAASKKADLKQNKDKLSVAKIAASKGGSSITNNTTLLVDTNTLIEQLKQMKTVNVPPPSPIDDQPINAEFTAIDNKSEKSE